MPGKSRQKTPGSGVRTATVLSPGSAPDEIRDEFRRAFEDYTKEGRIMRDLLLREGDGVGPERARVLAEQQERLNAAHASYEHCRCRYVACVLGVTGKADVG